MTKQPFDGNGGVVHLFVWDFPQLVPDLAAVAVNAKPDCVQETISLSFDFNGGKLLYVSVDGKGI